jgi:3-oxoacyl-[acyl-carrier protein] reductase
MKLEGKVAIVTGGSRGIGRAVAKTLAGEGASTVVNYVQGAKDAEAVVREVQDKGGRATSYGADVSVKREAQMLVDKAVAEYGTVDILVNNAGVLLGGTVLDTTEADWDRCLAVNLKGPYNTMQAAAKVMVKRRSGKIVNVSSISGLLGAPEGELAYSASKAGLNAMTAVAALDLGPYGINVNCIAPGWTVTEMVVRRAGSKEAFDRLTTTKAKQAIMGRVGDPQDIANAVLFLSSQDSNFITGQVIVVDGGRKDFLHM